MKISEIISENNQRIDLKLSTIFDKIHEHLEDSELSVKPRGLARGYKRLI